MALWINLRQVETSDLHLEGEIPAQEMAWDLADEVVRLDHGVAYCLTVSRRGREILVRGSVETLMNCECVRCLKWFESRLAFEDWEALIDLDGEEAPPVRNDEFDLSVWVREDFLLALPKYPHCGAEDCGLPGGAGESGKNGESSKGLSTGGGDNRGTGGAIWGALDRLKLD